MSFNVLIPSLGVAAVVFSSCAPLTPYSPNTQPGGQQVATTPQQTAEEQQAAEQKRIEEARAEARRQAENRESTPPSNPGTSNQNSGGGTTETKPDKPDYRRAIPIPGREGMVFNPFTNNPVDVRGIPSGSLVRDPADPNMDHKFRVP